MEFFLPVILAAGCLAYFLFGLFTLRVNPKSAVNRLFSLVCMMFALWALCHVFLQSAAAGETVRLWYRLSSIGAVFFTGFLAHFFLVITGKSGEYPPPLRRALYALFYGPAVFFVWAALAGRFTVEDFVVIRGAWVGVLSRPGPYFAAYTAWYNLLVIFSFALMLKWRAKSADRDEKNQARIILIYGITAYLLVSAGYLALALRGLRFPSIGILIPLLWIYGIWRAMTGYGMLGITPDKALTAIIESIHDGLLLAGGDGVIAWANPAAAKLTGRMRRELKGMKTGDIIRRITPEDAGRRGKPLPGEVGVIHRDGAESPALLAESQIIIGGAPAGRVFSLRDIAGLKEAEEALRRFKDIFDRANFGAAVADLRGNLTYVNTYFAEIHGYSREELEGKNLRIFHSPEQLLRVEELHERLFETNSYSAEEVRHVRRDGSEFPMLMNGFIMKDSSGNPLCIAATGIDISSIKQAEEALRESEERFRDIAEASGEYIWEMDVESRYTYASDRITEVLGRPLAEITGKTPFDFMPPEEAVKMKKICAAIFSEKKSFSGVECRSLLPSGEVVWQSKSGKPFFGKDGELAGYRGTAVDITTRKENEISLKALSGERTFLLNGVNTHIWYMKDERTYGFANRAHISFLGLDAENADGKDLFEILPPDAAREMAESNREAFTGKKKVVTEQWLPGAGGEKRLLGMTKLPHLDEAGRVDTLLCTAADITEKRIAEDKIRETLKLKSDFISMVSHELRTPLAIIKEGLAIVAEGVAGELTPRQSKLLATVTRNMDRLSRLITNVLDFQKLDSGKEKLDLRVGDINETVKETVELYKTSAESKGILLTAELDDKMPRFAYDSDKITQALINLIDNAVKFTGGGSVTVRTSMELPGLARISVTDTGEGLADIDPAKIFEMFEQGGDILRSKPAGVGLGLPITRRIIDLHGGQIRAEPSPEGGAVFSFTLPAGPAGRQSGFLLVI